MVLATVIIALIGAAMGNPLIGIIYLIGGMALTNWADWSFVTIVFLGAFLYKGIKDKHD